MYGQFVWAQSILFCHSFLLICHNTPYTGGYLETSLHISNDLQRSRAKKPRTCTIYCNWASSHALTANRLYAHAHRPANYTPARARSLHGTTPYNLVRAYHVPVVRVRRSDSKVEHNDFCSDKCRKCSENVRCPTVISCTVCMCVFVCYKCIDNICRDVITMPCIKRIQAVYLFLQELLYLWLVVMCHLCNFQSCSVSDRYSITNM